MINLIPPAGHESLKREYVLRVGATFCFLFGFVAVLLAAAHIPTYVLTAAQIQEIEAVVQKESGKEELVKAAEAEVHTAQTVVAQLRATKAKPAIASLIADIQGRAASGITLQTFTFSNLGESNEIAQVQGVAASRVQLAQFKIALESSPQFLRAEIPISDLAQDTDLPFVITLTLESAS